MLSLVFATSKQSAALSEPMYCEGSQTKTEGNSVGREVTGESEGEEVG